ncbi:MAG: carbon monoxide dehydrogenase [Proteobacteria bacterium]|nr:carbon monoxide dehydrogenase [Pseudomonadota bacterium]
MIVRSVEPRLHLADFVREELNLTGTHLGCEHGVCGACTLMVDGRPVRSCLTFVAGCHGAEVTTIEGFDDDPLMQRLQAAFACRHALQCGYCTPGMLATAYDIVSRIIHADERRIREELAGNLCRCTGYAGIVAAIAEVLAQGPHQAVVHPIRRASMATPAAIAVAVSMAVPSAAAVGVAAIAIPNRIADGVTLIRTLPVAVNVETLWTTLQDLGTVAACLPGGSIESIAPDGIVIGAFTVGIGPMRATFRGRAVVRFDQSERAGEVLGGGGDGASRSRAEGAIRFKASSVAKGASSLALEITYRIKGPLAQFGRPALVADVVDRLLEIFARNLVRSAEGGPVETPPIGGLRILFASFLGTVRRLLSKA